MINLCKFNPSVSVFFFPLENAFGNIASSPSPNICRRCWMILKVTSSNSNTGWYVNRPAVCLRHSSRLPIYLSIRYMTISIHRCDNLLASQICPYYFIYLYISIISVQSSLFICAIYIYIVCLVVWPNRTVQDRVANQQSNQKINPPTTNTCPTPLAYHNQPPVSGC